MNEHQRWVPRTFLKEGGGVMGGVPPGGLAEAGDRASGITLNLENNLEHGHPRSNSWQDLGLS